jgi:hypothetical protein
MARTPSMRLGVRGAATVTVCVLLYRFSALTRHKPHALRRHLQALDHHLQRAQLNAHC